jgi:transcription initiation factor TFIIIB Brf1 subunit/transcription initiation factor TFIIB
MAYPDLPPSPTFWRCPECGNENLFRASGIAHIECVRCGKVWTEQQLIEAHRRAHPETAQAAAAH